MATISSEPLAALNRSCLGIPDTRDGSTLGESTSSRSGIDSTDKTVVSNWLFA